MPTESQPPENSREVPEEPIVGETVCKTILTQYLKELRARVDLAVRRTSLANRVGACM
jgi:hypothetical protein